MIYIKNIFFELETTCILLNRQLEKQKLITNDL